MTLLQSQKLFSSIRLPSRFDILLAVCEAMNPETVLDTYFASVLLPPGMTPRSSAEVEVVCGRGI